MTIKSFERVQLGKISINPGDLRLYTDDTYATITTPGYLNKNWSSSLLLVLDITSADVITTYSFNKNGYQTVNFFSASFDSSGQITLNLLFIGGDVSGPLNSYDNAIALFANSGGDVIKTVNFTPSSLSLFGYDNSSIPANITLGYGLEIGDGDLLQFTPNTFGTVSGPESISNPGSLVVFNDIAGLSVREPTFTPSTGLLGYQTSDVVSLLVTGYNLAISGSALNVTSPYNVPTKVFNYTSSAPYFVSAADNGLNLILVSDAVFGRATIEFDLPINYPNGFSVNIFTFCYTSSISTPQPAILTCNTNNSMFVNGQIYPVDQIFCTQLYENITVIKLPEISNMGVPYLFVTGSGFI